jgi:hypothetical protein
LGGPDFVANAAFFSRFAKATFGQVALTVKRHLGLEPVDKNSRWRKRNRPILQVRETKRNRGIWAQQRRVKNGGNAGVAKV